MLSDPISDFIIRLQNGSLAKKTTVSVVASKFAENVAHLLKKAGYLSSVEKNTDKHELILGLVYLGEEPRIHGVERISKPSRRMYQKASDIRTYKSGFGNVVLSTSKGVLTDMEAKKLKVGGEILFKIW